MIDTNQIKQIWNERSINLWLWVELLLVSVVLWYIVDELYTTASVYFEPKGFNIEDTYLLSIDVLTSNSPEYTEKSKTDREAGEDLLEIVGRLRLHPEVEAVSLSASSYPYNSSNRVNNVRIDTFNADWVIRRLVTPDFLKVFRYKGLRGESPDELISRLTETGSFISGNNLYFDKYRMSLEPYEGKEFYFGNDTLNPRRLVAVTQPVRYSDFHSVQNSRYVLLTMSDQDIASEEEPWIPYYELCLRTRSGIAPGFEDRLRKEFDTRYRSGNLFIKGIRSMEKVRHQFQLDEVNDFRNYMWGIGFLLVNIFLGLLGTFWFRTQQRRSELALRMSFGSSRRQIFFYLLKEGIFLLILATLPAVFIDHILVMNEYNSWLDGYFGIGRFTITVLITFVLIAVTILLGIWYPAWQATKIHPAIALREE